MKKIAIIISFVLTLQIDLSAQNTFPPSGSVTIQDSTEAESPDINLLDGNGNNMLRLVNGANERGILEAFDEGQLTLRIDGRGNSIGERGILEVFDQGQLTVRINGIGDSYFNGGNIGIGTNAPNEKLHISGSGNVKALVESSDGHAYYVIEGASSMGSFVDYHRKGDGRVWHTGLRNGNNNFEFRLNNQSTVLTLKDDGHVGIGTTNPFQKLSLIDGQVFLGHSSPNLVESGRLRFSEYTNTFQGAFIHYNGSTNIFNIGIHQTNDSNITNDYNAISIRRDNGNVGIGTTAPDSKLAVNGTVHAKEVKVDLIGWPDFVFEKDHELRTLEEVEEHIEENGHLPEIPSEAEVTENGINLGEMNAKLLQKIEELTLYLIEQNKELKNAQTEILELKEKISQLAAE